MPFRGGGLTLFPQPAAPKSNPIVLAIAALALVVALLALSVALVLPGPLGPRGPQGPAGGDPGTPGQMGISVGRSSDGTNWVLLVASTPAGNSYLTTTLTIVRPDGTTNLSATAWANLDSLEEGCTLERSNVSATSVGPGDRLLCRVSWYMNDSDFQISDGSALLVVGRFVSDPDGPSSMGISVSRSSDGTNWVLIVTSTPSGKSYPTTTLSIVRSDGTTNLTATAWASLDDAGEGCTLQKANSTATTVNVGDRLLCQVSWYASGSGYQIADGIGLLAAGKMQG